MDVRNCKQCGRLFNYLSGLPICPSCKEKMEDKFIQTKEYIRDNPGATIQMVADENEVTVQQIRQWVREERLEFSKDSPVGIECEICGKTIRTGRYCENCKNKMYNNLSQIYQPKETLDSLVEKKKAREIDKMRFLKL
jgi:flagellar operon protein (TIGR03826 family)